MNRSVNDIVNEYIMYCGQLCKRAEDYTKENVKKHNKGMKKLSKLKEKIYIDKQLTENIYKVLLESEDSYVQQMAATECLQLNIHIDISVKILKRISLCGDKMSAMGAKRTLLIWEGKLKPSDPF